MWEIHEHKSVVRRLKNLPRQILERYEKWQDIVEVSGPDGLLKIKGFRDKELVGAWKGHRASRLNDQYHVIYRVENDEFLVLVIELTPHDYRRR